MNCLSIVNLDILEFVPLQDRSMFGGSITPRISTASDTALDTDLITEVSVSGNLMSGFSINRQIRGSAASAAASSASIDGEAFAFAFADAD